MVTIYNKSNRPVGVGKQFALPDKEIQVQDKDAYCAVFDEYGNNIGKKEILPGLKAMERMGLITIRVEAPQKPVEEKVEVKEEPKAEEEPKVAAEEEVEKKAPARRRTKKTAE